MNLLDQYLHAVGRYLPVGNERRQLAELRANLLDQMDAHQEETGRPMTEAEETEVLRARGKPELVAVRYRPQRSLSGPTIHPFYRFCCIVPCRS